MGIVHKWEGRDPIFIELAEIQEQWNDVLDYTEEELENDDGKFAEKAELRIWAERRGFTLDEETNVWSIRKDLTEEEYEKYFLNRK